MTSLLPPIQTWSDWTRLFDDMAVWRPVIDRICTIERIDFRDIETPRSNTNAVFLLDRRLVVKVYSPFWTESEMELRVIEALRAQGDVPVPTVVAAGSIEDRVAWDYLVLEYCSGTTLETIRPAISRDTLHGIATQLGQITRQLHGLDVRLLDDVDSGESWERLLDRRRHEVLTSLQDSCIVTRDAHMSISQLLDSTIEESASVPRVVVHGDLESDHVILRQSGRSWTIASIIDFGDAKIGVPDYELMPLWLGLFDRDVEAMRSFLRAYNPTILDDKVLRNRILAWTLLHDFGTEALEELLEKTQTPTPVESMDDMLKVIYPGLQPSRGSLDYSVGIEDNLNCVDFSRWQSGEWTVHCRQ